ncbi:hypothetical protein [Bradyrhizobium sp.]|uniref:hypothetical protein n=1 Tax=Bradyrhizobium sp. TaxID=376 RepID=UPI004037B5BB
MNHFIESADRATHCKIVAAALLAAVVIVGIATAARVNSAAGIAEASPVIKAGKPMVLTNRHAEMAVR